MIGDDTWVRLFGDFIDLSHGRDLFSITDIDDGDLISEKHHKEELKAKNISFLITHTVGLDHAGHYFRSKAHPEIYRKI
jgi:hypothetical protein